MTTGRINQVTIAGRGPHRNPHRPRGERRDNGGLPHRSASSAGVGGPRSQTVNDPSGHVLQSLAHESPTEGQRRARRPVASHSGRVDRRRVDTETTYRLLACTRSDATPTSQMAGAGHGASSPRTRAAAQPELPSKPGNASAGTRSRTQHPGRTLGRATSDIDFNCTHAQLLGAALEPLRSKRANRLDCAPPT